MDRRQRKTRKAIFSAFGTLLAEKKYNKITVQEIIDRADVGRTTFYSHFETKDNLLEALCTELFSHIISSAMESSHHTHGICSEQNSFQSLFVHLLDHLQENDKNILGLLSCESSEIFLRYFKDGLKTLIRELLINQDRNKTYDLPDEFLVNHISSSFVEMVLWWIKGRRKQTSIELGHYFKAIIEPIL